MEGGQSVVSVVVLLAILVMVLVFLLFLYEEWMMRNLRLVEKQNARDFLLRIVEESGKTKEEWVEEIKAEAMRRTQKEIEEKKEALQGVFQERLILLNGMKEAKEWDKAILFCKNEQSSIGASPMGGPLSRWWYWKWSDELKIIQDMMASPRRSRRIPTHVKREVLERDRGECVFCGSSEDIHYDHDIPFAKGGSNDVENIQILCSKCNLKKGNKII